MIYSDYCFISKSGQVLAEESLMADQVGDFAQGLARQHQTTVYIWIAGGEAVEPDKCTCGAILPEIGPCWNCLFEEEETEEERPTLAEMMAAEAKIRAKVETELYGKPISNSIPFQGEAYQAKVYSEFEEYF